jgi:hypothetical protein
MQRGKYGRECHISRRATGDEEYWLVSDEFLCTSRVSADRRANVKIDEVKKIVPGCACVDSTDITTARDCRSKRENELDEKVGIIWWRRIRPR